MNDFRYGQIELLESMGLSLLQVYAGKAGKTQFNLSIGQPEMPPPHLATQAVRAFSSNPQHARYTPAGGSVKSRINVAKVFEQLGFTDISQENVAISNGAKSLISSAMRTLGRVGTPVFWFEPGYTYGRMAMINGLNPVTMHLTNHPSEFDRAIALIDEHYRSVEAISGILIINTPTNPTGMVWSRDQLLKLAYLVSQYDMRVIADETYADLVYSGYEHISFAQLPEMFERTITIRSASKELRMPGYRIGYAVGPKNLMRLLKMVLGDCEGCPGTLSQAAFNAVATNHAFFANEQMPGLQVKRQMVMNWCDKNGFEYYPIGGAFYAFVNLESQLVKWRDSVGLADDLLKHDPSVGIIPGRAFSGFLSFDKWVRISFAGSEDDLVSGLGVIEQVLKSE